MIFNGGRAVGNCCPEPTVSLLRDLVCESSEAGLTCTVCGVRGASESSSVGINLESAGTSSADRSSAMNCGVLTGSNVFDAWLSGEFEGRSGELTSLAWRTAARRCL